MKDNLFIYTVKRKAPWWQRMILTPLTLARAFKYSAYIFGYAVYSELIDNERLRIRKG